MQLKIMEKKITNDSIPGEKHIVHSELAVTNSDLGPYFS